jgi:hypothetical protein
MLRIVLIGAGLLWLSTGAAQTLPGRPHRPGGPKASARGAAPSAWRNQAGPAAVSAPPPSRQDKQAYENCPDPRRYQRRHRKKLVRIW